MTTSTHPITRAQFDLVRPMLEQSRKLTRPRVCDLYDVLCAILYRKETGTGWRRLPDVFPAWRTVHQYYLNWTIPPADGELTLLDRVLEQLGLPSLEDAG